MKIIFTLTFLVMTVLQAKAQKTPAHDFTATTVTGDTFKLSDLKGKKIFLAFYRNGACALCNLRVHELSMRQADFDKAGIVMVAVFESTIEDMKPYLGNQKLAFTRLSDPTGKLYEMYGVTNSPERIKEVMESGSATPRIVQAEAAGYKLTPQEGSNFFRIPADVLIDKGFNIVKIHHCDQLTNHLPIEEVLKF